MSRNRRKDCGLVGACNPLLREACAYPDTARAVPLGSGSTKAEVEHALSGPNGAQQERIANAYEGLDGLLGELFD